MKPLAAGLLLLLAASANPDTGSQIEAVRLDPGRLEAFRYNPRERTRSGITALEEGDIDTALEHLDTAQRLDSSSPIAAFNSGTARLIAGTEDAASRLEEAAAVASDELLPTALYNLGNARLLAQEPAAAIDAYKQALRLDPGQMQAKFNLEVAQRLLEQQQEQQQQQEQDQQSDEQQQQDQNSPEDDKESQQEEPQPNETPDPESADQQPDEQEPGEESQDQEGSDSQNQEREQPLPNFENQEDMTAEQAAAILQAVENLEREQRRRLAEERARRRSRTGKDW